LWGRYGALIGISLVLAILMVARILTRPDDSDATRGKYGPSRGSGYPLWDIAYGALLTGIGTSPRFWPRSVPILDYSIGVKKIAGHGPIVS
jgi:hypothetical protein